MSQDHSTKLAAKLTLKKGKQNDGVHKKANEQSNNEQKGRLLNGCCRRDLEEVTVLTADSCHVTLGVVTGTQECLF